MPQQLNPKTPKGISLPRRMSGPLNEVVMHDGGVNAWMDDPLNGTPIQRPAPELENGNLSYLIEGDAVPLGFYSVGTANFRYWNAAEALRRGADFWQARIPELAWFEEIGPKLPIFLDDGVDFNAFYDRTALKFFHGNVTGGTVFSGESPDILCHEMGHAVLDAIRPDLWNVAAQEVAAFHESFGDMSSILSALQLPLMRAAVLEETGGHINRSSRLSRLAEQLAQAIREHFPNDVEPDCLRNASNSLMYVPPLFLPSRGPASILTAEPHSFSRVFTGGFLDALAGMLLAAARDPAAPTEDELLQVSAQMGDILVAGVRSAAAASDFYSQVAGGMVQAAGQVDAAFARPLKAAFVKRGILSVSSATSVQSLADAATNLSRRAAGAATPVSHAPSHLALDGKQYGLGDQALIVETPSQPRKFSANAAVADLVPVQVPSSEVAARGFVEQLFKQGRVDLSGATGDADRIDPLSGLKTHRLVKAGGALQLKRVLCDCGLKHD